MESNSKPLQTFYYHETLGFDKNGCPEVETSDPKWKTVQATNYTHAMSLLPKSLQEKYESDLKKTREELYWQEVSDDPVGEFIYVTCGWGMSWTLVDQENFDAMKESEE